MIIKLRVNYNNLVAYGTPSIKRRLVLDLIYYSVVLPLYLCYFIIKWTLIVSFYILKWIFKGMCLFFFMLLALLIIPDPPPCHHHHGPHRF